MHYRLFQYPLPAPPELADLNAYLGSHRIAAVTHHLAAGGSGSMLVFVVETAAPEAGASSVSRPRIDYRTELNEEDFAVFSRLRDWRKQTAESEGVPVYTIFTNAQLADMVRQRVRSLGDLEKIEGVGAGRLEKYGSALVTVLEQEIFTDPETGTAADLKA